MSKPPFERPTPDNITRWWSEAHHAPMPRCPSCGAAEQFYGMSWGLEGAPDEAGDPIWVPSIVLVCCRECGTVVGAYLKPEKREEKSST